VSYFTCSTKESEKALANLESELKQIKSNNEAVVNKLQMELSQLQSERDKLKTSSKSTEAAVNNLQEQLNALTKEKDHALSQLEMILKEKETLIVQLTAHSKEQNSQEEIRKLQANHSSVVEQLNADLQKAKQERDDLSNKLQASSKGQDSTVAQLQDDIKKLTADLEKQRQKNNVSTNFYISILCQYPMIEYDDWTILHCVLYNTIVILTPYMQSIL
jgi:DNA repair exonuclease SbcCD ATPase subunit